MTQVCRKGILIIGPDCTDARVRKRIQAFDDLGFEVAACTYRRHRYNRDYQPEWKNLDLGQIQDRRYAARIVALLRGMLRIFRKRHILKKYAAIYAINLDCLLLAYAFKRMIDRRIQLVYEVADIQPVLIRQGVFPALLRRSEAWLLKKIDLLVVTSEAFVEHYFKAVQGYEGKWYLLENKLIPEERLEERGKGVRRTRLDCIKVGWFGALKCRRSWDILQEIKSNVGDKIEIHLAGYPTAIDAGEFFERIKGDNGFIYHGEYSNPDDLGKLYGAIDICWCIDLVNERYNSRWLLPNRIYESGYFGIPVLAPKDFHVGKYVERYGLGWTVAEPYVESVVRFIRQLRDSEYLDKHRKIMRLPKHRFCGNEDYRKLGKVMEQSVQEVSDVGRRTE